MKLKRALIFLLTLSMLLPAAVACKKRHNVSDDPTGSAGTSDTDSGTGESEKDPFTLAETRFSVICPDLQETVYRDALIRIRDTMEAGTGVRPEVVTDFEKGGKAPIQNDNFEILVGDTNRAESAQVECEAGSYTVCVVNRKVVIKGSDEFYTWCAVEYFVENCISGESGTAVLKIAKGYTHTESGVKKTFGKMLSLGMPIASRLKKTRVMTIAKEDGYTCIQGGATDGKWLYFLLNDGKTDDTAKSRLIKVNPATMKVEQTLSDILCVHANDMTYNSKTGKLMISHCNVDATKYTVINPETMTVEGVKSASVGFFGIAYVPERNGYVIAKSGTYDLCILNASLRVTRELSGENTGWVKQGIDADNDRIYYMQSPSSSLYKENRILTYDWDGNLTHTFTIDSAAEGEHLMWLDNCFYAGFNNSQSGTIEIYRLDYVFG